MSCFYEQGLRFTCQPGCRYCCGVEPGYVFLTSADLQALCTYLSLSKAEVLSRYCRKVPMGSFSYVSLIEKANNDCTFLAPHGCSIYPARPIQCSTYPFWATILDSQKNWENEAQWCPGINKGEIISAKEIEDLLNMRKGVEPAIWEEVVH